MVTVKVECPCGQHYAFDVEPVNGRLPSTVACPVCGADGTAAANAIIATKLPPPFTPPRARAVPAAIVPTAPLVAPEPPPASPALAGLRVNARVLGLVDRDTAETEARAKMSWGDSKEDVERYLMLQGFSAPEAQEVVKGLYKERLAALRVKGIRKILIGIGAMCTPVVALVAFLRIGIIPMKLMAITVMVALWGVWQLLNGILMLVAPKMESGDLAD